MRFLCRLFIQTYVRGVKMFMLLPLLLTEHEVNGGAPPIARGP
jgi:hypothetical protein